MAAAPRSTLFSWPHSLPPPDVRMAPIHTYTVACTQTANTDVCTWTAGMRVEPPTRMTSSMSSYLSLAS